jgi:hypothetical protein
MFNTFKTIKNHNDKITKAHGEELLHIELSEREKGLIETLDIKQYPYNPSMENVGDYLLTMLTNDNFYDGVVLMGQNAVDPFDIVYYIDNNPKWREHADPMLFIDITKEYYKRWNS